MSLDLYTRNIPLTQKARFWGNYVSALKGQFSTHICMITNSTIKAMLTCVRPPRRESSTSTPRSRRPSPPPTPTWGMSLASWRISCGGSRRQGLLPLPLFLRLMTGDSHCCQKKEEMSSLPLPGYTPSGTTTALSTLRSMAPTEPRLSEELSRRGDLPWRKLDHETASRGYETLSPGTNIL